MYFLICDGGAKPSGCYGSCLILEGRTLADPGIEILSRKIFGLPDADTNNEAEYHALLQGLTELRRIIPRDGRRRWIKVLMDSELVVKQVSGVYKVRAPNLMNLYRRAKLLLGRFRQISLLWIDRGIIEGYLGH